MVLSKYLVLDHFDLVFPISSFFKLVIFVYVFLDNFFDFSSWSGGDSVGVPLLFLIWVVLIFGGWISFQGSPVFSELKIELLRPISLVGFLLNQPLKQEHLGSPLALKILVPKLPQILKRFINKKQFLNRSSNLNLINKVIQINPFIHNVVSFIIISLQIIEFGLCYDHL